MTPVRVLRARVVATPCKGRDLMPGDLFSYTGPGYWDDSSLGADPAPDSDPSFGERVYIRTNTQMPPAFGPQPFYRIQIVLEEAETAGAAEVAP